MPAVRTNGAVFGYATKISAQVMPRMMMAVLKFSVNFQVRRNVSAPKAKRTAGALKPFTELHDQYRKEQNDRQFGRFC